ncbi:ligase-associated DNA damage response endonuclease PdeM [Sphingobacterium corticibacterium]|uniref:Ligase-associated DNA damage response endonuclease PdeM n=1 Tax=Sphingobacterium corticibacterium TaxID=2484746 RepID=A0A4Q6XV15_9SPHI|nr:ligase-associated DNA damage response endonuclease PdeM [Sphingobacterium corticibacterium]RZF61334.1 ligase-associated DNA damage response endonuclease PdeM [Sphingobacterium corticibacterium]
MNIITQDISFSDTSLTLTNQRVLFWEKHHTLILSDLHLGKAAHFRKNGIALPTQVTLQDLQRLEQLIHYFPVKQVIIVGDLIHAGANTEVDLLRQFIAKFPHIKFILIKGNHDRFADERWKKLGIQEIYQNWRLDNICFTHQASSAANIHTVSGHIHPGVSVRMPTKRTMTFPCFVVSAQQIILPAFSLFTGFDIKSTTINAIRYAFHENDIFCIR